MLVRQEFRLKLVTSPSSHFLSLVRDSSPNIQDKDSFLDNSGVGLVSSSRAREERINRSNSRALPSISCNRRQNEK